MTDVCNLDICLGGYFSLFSKWQSWVIYKKNITDTMAIMIRVVELMAGCF